MQTCCGHFCCRRISTKEHATVGLHGCLPGRDGNGEVDSVGRVLASGAEGAVASIRFPGRGGGGGGVCAWPLIQSTLTVRGKRNWAQDGEACTRGRGKGCDIAAACPAPPGGRVRSTGPTPLGVAGGAASPPPPESRCRKRPPPKAACAPGMAASPPRAQES